MKNFISFKDWVLTKESSAATRLRRDAALGLKPPIPDAMLHSRSTASPFEVEEIQKKNKKKKKKKGHMGWNEDYRTDCSNPRCENYGLTKKSTHPAARGHM